MTWALTYLTQCRVWRQNFFAVTGQNILLLLPSVRYCATSAKTGCADVVSIGASLTNRTTGGRNWLSLRLPAHAQERKQSRTSAFLNSLRQRARSLPKWNYQCHPITALSKLSFRTKLRSRSIWNRACKSLLSLSVGSLAATNPRNAGDPFTAFNPFSIIKIKPAFSGRVFASGLASRSSPEEYGGEQIAVCGGAL
jgi:hypothetical protein